MNRSDIALLAIGLALLAGCAREVKLEERGWIGAKFEDFPANTFDRGGVLVLDVSPDSPAADAGLREGDQVVQVNGAAIDGSDDFRDAVRAAAPGSALELAIFRGDLPFTFRATAGREVYDRQGLFSIGLGLSGTLQPIPTPEFTWFGLVRFQRSSQVPELHSEIDRAYGRNTGNSWEFFLIPFGIGKRDLIYSQERASSSSASGATAPRSGGIEEGKSAGSGSS